MLGLTQQQLAELVGAISVTQHQCMMLEVARNFADNTNEHHQEALNALSRALASTH
jgi:hypothetical protein